ncbi:hypothetical protein SDC9_158874 [bioreactor metagenome]|uniref:Uncharacterized protein n=1 Tax=bioreactor metagenome TaxID=1076179 RepID=A0A645FB81_9ZZZZ
MVDVFEMLHTGIFDGDLMHGDTQRLHQLQGVIVGTVGSAESGHGNTHHLFTVIAKFISCFYANQ